MATSYKVWAAFGVLFLIVELLGVFHVFGWVSLSETVWTLEKAGPVIKSLLLAGLIVLTTHLVLGWPR